MNKRSKIRKSKQRARGVPGQMLKLTVAKFGRTRAESRDMFEAHKLRGFHEDRPPSPVRVLVKDGKPVE